jgi:TrmH family RNA methyltransferase
MLSKNAIKYYSTLLNKKYRERERKFIVEGKRLLEEALNSEFEPELIVATQKYLSDNKVIIEKLSQQTKTEIVKEVDFKRLSDTQNPQGILGVFSRGQVNFVFEPDTNFVLALENISDPGNLGTIIRNADWFGVSEILLSENCADLFNPKTLRASMGSIFHVKFSDKIDFYIELENIQKSGYEILVADMEGENVYQHKLNKKSILVLSNEAHGPSDKLLSLSDRRITIPKKGTAESLNVASASAVLLNELTR